MTDKIGVPLGTVTLATPRKPTWAVSFTSEPWFQINGYTAPNRFHRWMQRVLFGIYWRPL